MMLIRSWKVPCFHLALTYFFFDFKILSVSSYSFLFEGSALQRSSVQRFAEIDNRLHSIENEPLPRFTVDKVVLSRHGCKHFRRHDGKESFELASQPNESIVETARHCLSVARHAPSAFNTQPWKVILVHSQQKRQELAQFCLGPNADRVLDADCTAIFLADKEIFRTFPRFRQFIREQRKGNLKLLPLLRTQFYITLFSSGYPLPRIIAAPISFCVRTVVAFLNLFSSTILRYPLPTLANAETWASKQTLLMSMIYMLSCTAHGLATIPMEGINASGIRRVLNIPRRYAIPVIVSTGLPYQEDLNRKDESLRRYPAEEVIFSDSFGQAFQKQ